MARSVAPPPPPALAPRDRILAASLPLFAASGFDGVSMRHVASAVGVTPAALYYHFPDKEQLYVAVIAHAYNDRLPALIEQLVAAGDPWQRLENLVAGMVQLSIASPDLMRLAQWILLDTDPERPRQLARNVFRPFLEAITALAGELGGGQDAHRLSVSVMSLTVFPFQAAVVMRHLPGHRAPQEDPAALTRHVMHLLRNGIAAENRV